jgi:hypothetical protein
LGSVRRYVEEFHQQAQQMLPACLPDWACDTAQQSLWPGTVVAVLAVTLTCLGASLHVCICAPGLPTCVVGWRLAGLARPNPAAGVTRVTGVGGDVHGGQDVERLDLPHQCAAPVCQDHPQVAPARNFCKICTSLLLVLASRWFMMLWVLCIVSSLAKSGGKCRQYAVSVCQNHPQVACACTQCLHKVHQFAVVVVVVVVGGIPTSQHPVSASCSCTCCFSFSLAQAKCH